MTDDLLSWLTARLDETEAAARAAEGDAASPWIVRDDEGLVRHSGPPDNYAKDDGLWDSEGCTETFHRLCMTGPVAEHVAAHAPSVVLADVEAKRAIAALHEPNSFGGCSLCGWSDGYEYAGQDPWPCDTLRILASCYRHHPGWRAEWAPETTP